MKKGMFMAVFALVVVAFLAAPLTSYAGGTITGKVTYSGKSEEKEFLFSKFPNPKFCPKNPNKELVKGEKRILPTIQVGKDGGLKAAVVAVNDIEDKAFMDGYKGTDIVSEFCEFLPFTGVVVKKKNFHVENHDSDPDDPGPKGDFPGKKGVLHNPHTFEVLGASSSTVFNIALAEKGSKLDKPVVLRKDKQGSILRLQCDQHEFMQGFFLPVENPHYTVVKDDGTFEIKDVPAGKHKVVAWHPFAGKVEAEVDVTEGGTAQAKFEIKKK
ncbi:MAG: carboxypeptidase regulatory-like domain-containing protein [Nitrospirae bacterium]|nr:carboxypeptidase regulatory-like domain-containing protein [Nitrospirota bacterium]